MYHITYNGDSICCFMLYVLSGEEGKETIET